MNDIGYCDLDVLMLSKSQLNAHPYEPKIEKKFPHEKEAFLFALPIQTETWEDLGKELLTNNGQQIIYGHLPAVLSNVT